MLATESKTGDKPQKTASESRRAGYQRNMDLMRAYKESHACATCGKRFPHYMMEFDAPKEGEWSIPRLAGSRCTADALMKAMQKTKLYCANHRAAAAWEAHHE